MPEVIPLGMRFFQSSYAWSSTNAKTVQVTKVEIFRVFISPVARRTKPPQNERNERKGQRRGHPDRHLAGLEILAFN